MADNSGDLSLGYMMGQSEGNNGGFGGNFGEGLWAVIILAILFGRGGFGGLGGFGGGGGGDGVSAGFAWQGIDNGIRGIQQGLCDGFYAVNTGMLNGFHGVDNAICNLGYQTQSGFNALGHQISDCCCTTQRAIDGVNYNMAKGFCDLGNVISISTRDIVDNNNANYRDLKDFLVTEKLSAKDARIAALEAQVGRAEQSALIGAQIDAAVATILRRTGAECPTAAYLVNAPTPVNFPVNSCGQVQFGGYGNNCGCGCGCG